MNEMQMDGQSERARGKERERGGDICQSIIQIVISSKSGYTLLHETADPTAVLTSNVI